MLKLWQQYTIIAALLFLLFFQIALWASPSVFLGERQQENTPQQAPKKEADNLFFGLSSEAWTAIFTGFLTVSTVGLWLATREADKTNRVSANAALAAATIAERSLTDLEGPFLFPEIKSHELVTLFRGYKWYDHETSPHQPLTPKIEFCLKNFGRTPAFPQSISAVFFCGGADDRHYDNRGGFLIQSLIGPGETTDPITRSMEAAISTWDDYKGMMGGPARVFLRGSVTFFDIFGHRWEQTFCLSWNSTKNGFMAWNPKLNRRKRIRSSEDPA